MLSARRFPLLNLLLVLSLTGLLSFNAPDARSEETLKISTREDTPTNRFAENVLRQAYADIGIKVTFLKYPGARSLKEANDGNTDGEVARLDFALENAGNLRKIPQPLFQSEISVFAATNQSIQITNWSDFQSYTSCTVHGFNLIENNLRAYNPRVRDTTAECISLVEAGRVQVAVTNRILGLRAMHKLGTQSVIEHSPPLEQHPVYHLLHKKHEHLIPEVQSALKAMSESGTIDTMWRQFILAETR